MPNPLFIGPHPNYSFAKFLDTYYQFPDWSTAQSALLRRQRISRLRSDKMKTLYVIITASIVACRISLSPIETFAQQGPSRSDTVEFIERILIGSTVRSESPHARVTNVSISKSGLIDVRFKTLDLPAVNGELSLVEKRTVFNVGSVQVNDIIALVCNVGNCIRRVDHYGNSSLRNRIVFTFAEGKDTSKFLRAVKHLSEFHQSKKDHLFD